MNMNWNMWVRSLIVFVLSFFFSAVLRGQTEYAFRVYLNNKGEAQQLLDDPLRFLSPAALERRYNHQIAVDITDVPVPSNYIDSLVNAGVRPLVKSRWFSTVVVGCVDSIQIKQVEQLSMVDSVVCVWKGNYPDMVNNRETTDRIVPDKEPLPDYYGYAQEQIEMLNGIFLHQAGFTGEGMRVAVIDAGFHNVDRLAIFDRLKLEGTYNVIMPGESVFIGEDHGTKVLSCVAAGLPGVMVGTAPDASYWLIKSEDTRSEFPIEEDYWAAAVEFADSVGADVISSSLGYFHFDEEGMNYDQSLLDGNTSFISRAARMAGEKGILLFSSAGNEGNSSWGKITFPADASSIVTVGAVTIHKEKSTFSSTGFTADYRVKPDIVALGTSCTIVGYNGQIRYGNGTSFSTPIVAGLGTCLWQAFPELNNHEIIDLLKESSSQYRRPDAELGYGIPDLTKAFQLKQNQKTGL